MDCFALLIPLFVKKGAHLNVHDTSVWRNIPLTWAIANRAYASAYEHILTGLCDVTLQDGNGKTALHFLIAKNYSDMTHEGEPLLRTTPELIEALTAQVQDAPEAKRTPLDCRDDYGNTAASKNLYNRLICLIFLKVRQPQF